MFYDTFDNGFGGMPSIDSGFGSPMFNGTGCFPVQPMNMGFNGSFSPSFDFGLGMPVSCGYTPTPFGGCNPISMDLSGNVCIDGIPITPSTPPAWMTARAAQAQMYSNQLEMQLNDPNFWMNFLPQGPLSSSMPSWSDWSSANWQSAPVDASTDPMADGLPFATEPMSGMNPQMGIDMGQTDDFEPITPMWEGEEVLPCGLTRSQYDQRLSKYQDLLADCERQLSDCGPYNSAIRAMIQNNIDEIKRNIRDLDKPF